jgi:cytoskeletal protein RodZ
MESLGIKLKNTRERKKESYENASLKTNIAVRYLKGLEEEDFSVFPGEAYLLGFLKTYGNYLGLEPEELLNLYRTMKLQEQPMPDKLLKTPREFPVKTVLLILILLICAGAVGGIIYFLFHLPPKEQTAPQPRKVKEYTMSENPMERRLLLEDSFVVPYNGANYQFVVINIGEDLTLASPIGEIRLNLGEETSIDMDNNGSNELKIAAIDFVKNHPDTGARLRFELDHNAPIITEPETSAAVPETPMPLQSAVPILSSPTPYPFTLQINFQGYCLFRWEILAERDRQGRNEQYFERNKELSVQAQNGVRIGASNAIAVKIQVIGGGKTVPLDLGGAGEVVVADIRWIKQEDNRYRLVLSRLE